MDPYRELTRDTMAAVREALAPLRDKVKEVANTRIDADNTSGAASLLFTFGRIEAALTALETAVSDTAQLATTNPLLDVLKRTY